MKNIIPIFLCISLLLSGCTTKPEVETKENKSQYKKAIWITYYELSDFTKNSSKEQFEQKINDVFEQLFNIGFNTAVIQVRPCCDAFYISKYFPSSVYFNGQQGSDMNYDPLKIICEVGKNHNINIEAWINPYRVSQNDDYGELSKDNFASKNKNMTKVVNGKIYLNPAYEQVTELICNGVKEIIDNYDISAIHFDDYFYPTTDKNFDKKEYEQYNSELSLSDWRRDNVNKMIQKVSKIIETTNSNIEFGVSPASDIENNKNNLYADVECWMKNGWIDYVCPQIYFGFKNEIQPFMTTAKRWVKLAEKYDTKVYIGLPLYKSNCKDNYASTDKSKAINEFKNNKDIISRQIKYISNFDIIKGYFIFSYSQLNSEKAKEEVSNMYEIMQNNNLQ